MEALISFSPLQYWEKSIRFVMSSTSGCFVNIKEIQSKKYSLWSYFTLCIEYSKM